MSEMTSLCLFILLNVIVHQYQCEENRWQKFRTSYWESNDDLTCYRTVTLQLFENLKKIVDVSVVESAENNFKSKVKPQSNISSFFKKENETNEELLKRRLIEAGFVAYTGLYNIRYSLLYKCNSEKQKQIMEFTKIFKEGIAECKDPKFLHDSIWWLERTCGPLVTEKKPQVVSIIPPNPAWKPGVSLTDYSPQ